MNQKIKKLIQHLNSLGIHKESKDIDFLIKKIAQKVDIKTAISLIAGGDPTKLTPEIRGDIYQFSRGIGYAYPDDIVAGAKLITLTYQKKYEDVAKNIVFSQLIKNNIVSNQDLKAMGTVSIPKLIENKRIKIQGTFTKKSFFINKKYKISKRAQDLGDDVVTRDDGGYSPVRITPTSRLPAGMKLGVYYSWDEKNPPIEISEEKAKELENTVDGGVAYWYNGQPYVSIKIEKEKKISWINKKSQGLISELISEANTAKWALGPTIKYIQDWIKAFESAAINISNMTAKDYMNGFVYIFTTKDRIFTRLGVFAGADPDYASLVKYGVLTKEELNATGSTVALATLHDLLLGASFVAPEAFATDIALYAAEDKKEEAATAIIFAGVLTAASKGVGAASSKLLRESPKPYEVLPPKPRGPSGQLAGEISRRTVIDVDGGIVEESVLRSDGVWSTQYSSLSGKFNAYPTKIVKISAEAAKNAMIVVDGLKKSGLPNAEAISGEVAKLISEQKADLTRVLNPGRMSKVSEISGILSDKNIGVAKEAKQTILDISSDLKSHSEEILDQVRADAASEDSPRTKTITKEISQRDLHVQELLDGRSDNKLVPTNREIVEPSASSPNKSLSLSNKIINLNISEIKNPDGSIGRQGFSRDGIREVLMHVAGLDVPEDLSTREMIAVFKSNPEAQKRLRDFMINNPLLGEELPDRTIHILDGHHRAFLLSQIGDATIPSIIKNYTGPSSDNKTTVTNNPPIDTGHPKISLYDAVQNKNKAIVQQVIPILEHESNTRNILAEKDFNFQAGMQYKRVRFDSVNHLSTFGYLPKNGPGGPYDGPSLFDDSVWLQEGDVGVNIAPSDVYKYIQVKNTPGIKESDLKIDDILHIWWWDPLIKSWSDCLPTIKLNFIIGAVPGNWDSNNPAKRSRSSTPKIVNGQDISQIENPDLIAKYIDEYEKNIKKIAKEVVSFIERSKENIPYRSLDIERKDVDIIKDMVSKTIEELYNSGGVSLTRYIDYIGLNVLERNILNRDDNFVGEHTTMLSLEEEILQRNIRTDIIQNSEAMIKIRSDARKEIDAGTKKSIIEFISMKVQNLAIKAYLDEQFKYKQYELSLDFILSVKRDIIAEAKEHGYYDQTVPYLDNVYSTYIIPKLQKTFNEKIIPADKMELISNLVKQYIEKMTINIDYDKENSLAWIFVGSGEFKTKSIKFNARHLPNSTENSDFFEQLDHELGHQEDHISSLLVKEIIKSTNEEISNMLRAGDYASWNRADLVSDEMKKRRGPTLTAYVVISDRLLGDPNNNFLSQMIRNRAVINSSEEVANTLHDNYKQDPASYIAYMFGLDKYQALPQELRVRFDAIKQLSGISRLNNMDDLALLHYWSAQRLYNFLPTKESYIKLHQTNPGYYYTPQNTAAKLYLDLYDKNIPFLPQLTKSNIYNSEFFIKNYCFADSPAFRYKRVDFNSILYGIVHAVPKLSDIQKKMLMDSINRFFELSY